MAVELELEPFYRYHLNVIGECLKFPYERSLMTQVNWSEKAIMVIGQRGVGKTTLLCQYALKNYSSLNDFLYLSGDFYLLAESGLYRTIDYYFRTRAAACVIIDEIHGFPNWTQELKNLLDSYKNKQILISGNSGLNLIEGRDGLAKDSKSTKVDLCRRRALYELETLSFREYLELKFKQALPRMAIADLLKNALDLAIQTIKIVESCQTTILKEFESYLDHGSYPYFLEAPSSFGRRLSETIELSLTHDIGLVMDLEPSGINKLKRLFAYIVSSKPMIPNISAIARELGAGRETIYRYLHYLELSGLIRVLYKDITKASHLLNRPDKICVSNPNILGSVYDLRLQSERRVALRESFFVSNFGQAEISASARGDFRVLDYIFEVGGPSKTAEQIKGINNAYVVRDGQELPIDNVLPLWIFGFVR